MLENLKIITMSDIKIWNSYIQGSEEKHSGGIICIEKRIWSLNRQERNNAVWNLRPRGAK